MERNEVGSLGFYLRLLKVFFTCSKEILIGGRAGAIVEDE